MTQKKQPGRTGHMTKEQFEKKHGAPERPLFEAGEALEKGFGKRKFGTRKF